MNTMGSQQKPSCEPVLTLSREHLFTLTLLLGIVMVFGQSLGFQFLNWDDPRYILSPPVSLGLTVAGVKEAFTSQLMNHWHPLTILSHMLDVEMFGLNPGPHHGVSVFIHALNSLLLFTLLKFATRTFWPSALVTTLWALHPLHVENVVWLSDRKDLLCTFFGLVALHAYVRFVRCRRLRWYGLVLLCYCLGLLSKSMIITLPVMCLLLDVWPLDRLALAAHGRRDASKAGSQRYLFARTSARLLLEKIPLFVLALGIVILAYATTQRSGWLEYYGRVDFWGRLTNSLCAHVWYMVKTVWPTRVTGHYIHPALPGGTPWAVWQIVGSVGILIGISWAVWRLRRPYLAMGWLWFLLVLAPVNGMVQFGNPSRAGRYIYLPMIGLLIMFVWGAGELVKHYAPTPQHLVRKVAIGMAIGIVVLHATVSWIEAGYWSHDKVFCERLVALTPNNPYQNHNLALVYSKLGRYEEAKYHAKKAVAIWPMVYQAHDLLTKIYAREGNDQLAGFHRNQASDIRRKKHHEHQRAIAQDSLAATASRYLTEK